jgi:hypothetical protein
MRITFRVVGACHEGRLALREASDCRVNHGLLEIQTGSLAYQFFAEVFASLDVSIALADDHLDPEQLSRAFRISNG